MKPRKLFPDKKTNLKNKRVSFTGQSKKQNTPLPKGGGGVQGMGGRRIRNFLVYIERINTWTARAMYSTCLCVHRRLPMVTLTKQQLRNMRVFRVCKITMRRKKEGRRKADQKVPYSDCQESLCALQQEANNFCVNKAVDITCY